MEILGVIEKTIGHIAWPLAVFLIFHQFSSEIKTFIKRIKNAKYKGVELDLENEIQNIKSNAESAGITILYPSSSFPEDSIRNIEIAPEWAFIKSWQEVENVLLSYYSKISGLKKTGRVSIRMTLSYLESKGLIDAEMTMLIQKLQSTRNLIVHNSDSNITRGEALEWLGISKSIKDRLEQKLR